MRRRFLIMERRFLVKEWCSLVKDFGENQRQWSNLDKCCCLSGLPSRKEMSVLFPDCEIMVEYLLPFVPKSYVAIRR